LCGYLPLIELTDSMLANLKALIVILTFAIAVFALARPICLRFMAAEDFDRRRMVWFLLTTMAFVSPSFWLYVLVAAPVMLWAGKRDASPLALYFLLVFIVPPFSIDIPIIGINKLFDLSQQRLLGIFILLPAVLRRPTGINNDQPSWFLYADIVLLLYGVLQLVLFMPYESTTNTLRRASLFLLDTYLIYFAFSRLNSDRRVITDAFGALCLSACIYASVAIFESQRKWLLYTGIGERWGVGDTLAWLLRGDSLRAQASLGHSLTLGFSLAMGVGAWMYLKSTEPSRLRRGAIFFLLSAGLFFTYSRAPWLSAALVSVLYLGFASKSLVSFIRSILLLVAIAGGIALTPLGDAVISLLPGVGSVGQETVDYRQALAETSWRLIQLHPLLGNPFVLLDMEELRQGQGIIDLVNAYAAITLFYGVVGLVLYCGVFLVSLIAGFRCLIQSRAVGDADMVSIGAALLACVIVTLLFMGTAGFIWIQWQLAGLLMGYAGLRVVRALPEPILRERFAA
jgi:O-Antigen ligase